MRFKIDRLDHYGRGITYVNNKITFVNNALIDEVVYINIVKETSKYIEADMSNVIDKSPDRVDAVCPYYGICGGCNIMHMNYLTQLKFKEEKIKNILSKYGEVSFDKINSIIPSNQFNYRNKIILHVVDKKIGLYKKNSNDIVEIDYCKIVDEDINKIIFLLRDFIKETDNKIEEVIIRKNDGILLYINGKVERKELLKYFSDINIIVNDEVILNNGYIIDTLNSKKFIISPNSFYQVNEKQIEKLYGLVVDYIKDNNYKSVLDLYCGTGTIGIIVSDYVESVIGVEISKSSYLDALKNKELNNVENIDFILGKVEDNIDKFKDIDLIIVDPPRGGLDKHTIDVLKDISSKTIIYVSCDPMTLSRDIKLLSDCYRVEKVTPVDMFPNTYHVESVSVLKFKENIELE